jgi:hypothetical protein
MDEAPTGEIVEIISIYHTSRWNGECRMPKAVSSSRVITMSILAGRIFIRKLEEGMVLKFEYKTQPSVASPYFGRISWGVPTPTGRFFSLTPKSIEYSATGKMP